MLNFTLGFMYVCFGFAALMLGILALLVCVAFLAYAEMLAKQQAKVNAKIDEKKNAHDAAHIRAGIELLVDGVPEMVRAQVRQTVKVVGDNIAELNRIHEKLKKVVDSQPKPAAS